MHTVNSRLESALFDQRTMNVSHTNIEVPRHRDGWFSVDCIEQVFQCLTPRFSLKQGVPH
jgi:hypothetical protein